MGVWADFRVSDQRQATSPAQRADQLLQALPRWQWRTIRWRQGSKGWLRKKFVAVRGWRVTREGQRHVGWLLALPGDATRVGSPRRGSTTGAICRHRPRWTSWPAMPIGGMPSNSSMKRPKVRWAGIGIKGGCGRASTGIPSRSCWPTASWSGWSCANGTDRETEVAPATHFPPRPDRRRQTLPAIHREVARWLRHQAVQWWVTTDRFIEPCSRRF